MRKPRNPAPLLRAACDLQFLLTFNVKTLENEPLLRAACDLQLLLPSNENTSKPMNHCSRAACDLQLLMTSDETTSKTMAPLLRAACDLQLLLPFNLKNLENEPLLRVACDPQLLLPSNDKKTSKTMNHCSALPATCTPPPLPASGPRTLLQSTRPLSASPPAHSQPHGRPG